MQKEYIKKGRTLALSINKFPTFVNFLNLLNKGFGGIFPFSLGLLSLKLLHRKLLYQPDI